MNAWPEQDSKFRFSELLNAWMLHRALGAQQNESRARAFTL